MAQASGDAVTASQLTAKAMIKESDAAVLLAQSALDTAKAKEEQARATVEATDGADESAILALQEAEANTKLAQSSLTTAQSKAESTKVEAKKIIVTAQSSAKTAENTEKQEENTEAVSGAANVMMAWIIAWQRAIDKIKKDSPEIGWAVQTIFDSSDAWVSKIKAINELDVYSTFNNIEAHKAEAQIEALTKSMESLRREAVYIEAAGKFTFNGWGPAYDMMAAIKRANAATAQMRIEQIKVAESTRKATEGFEELQRQLEDGDITSEEFARGLIQLQTLYGKITDETMREFEKSIASSREEMENFTDSAEDGLKSVQREWAELNNQKMDALVIEQQIERLEIEKEIIDAEKDGNADAVRALKEKLRITGN
jgi:hypothetical protein